MNKISYLKYESKILRSDFVSIAVWTALISYMLVAKASLMGNVTIAELSSLLVGAIGVHLAFRVQSKLRVLLTVYLLLDVVFTICFAYTLVIQDVHSSGIVAYGFFILKALISPSVREREADGLRCSSIAGYIRYLRPLKK